jgi:hypothetical protein
MALQLTSTHRQWSGRGREGGGGEPVWGLTQVWEAVRWSSIEERQYQSKAHGGRVLRAQECKERGRGGEVRRGWGQLF